jgi:2-dehydro-3-deoxyphosphogluconate aldolase/(4S)-4-hydroxy-2-oxoglutarate aldolase
VNLSKFKKLPLLGILRGVTSGQIGPLIETIASSGLETIEIAMNTKGAAGLIKKAIAISGGRLTIGAGTVLTMEDLKSAINAGATFIVMPVLVPEVVDYCVRNQINVFPGALTPLEIYQAWRAGATMVKVFPTTAVGREYFKEIKGPFNDVKLLACGGVSPENLAAYFESGADAVAFGSSVFRQDWLENNGFKHIGQSIRKLVDSWNQFKSSR